ncbi:MAG: phosphodiesterase, partial [Clostridia bacterium]|nr:phosphodiesterase [Clostridia bacterium]
MKYLIASDLHGSATYTEQLLEAYARERADRLLLLGDVLYHGPRNDLPDGYAPKRVADLLNARRGEILSVRGNCEAEVDQMMLNFPVLGDYCLLAEGDHTVFATHGHIFNRDNLPPLKEGDVLLYGHTHVPLCETV